MALNALILIFCYNQKKCGAEMVKSVIGDVTEFIDTE